MTPTANPAATLRPGVVWNREGSEPGYLFDAATGGLYGLNRSAAALVSRLADGPCSVEALTEALILRFEVDPDTARRDAGDFLHLLRENGLVASA